MSLSAAAARNRGPWGHLAWVAVMALLASGCRGTLPIGQLLDDPYRYDGRDVRVAGEVVRSVGAVGYGVYQVDDGTGALTIVSRERGAPREGARVRVDGRFKALLTVGRRSVAGLLERKRRHRP
ncbi:MAG: hypothetical protein ACE5HQ_13220 [Gemmatimonadota bacterium]